MALSGSKERPLRAHLAELVALRARAIAASTRLLPSRWWRRTAGPQPKQVLGYLAASGPLMEARSRDRSGSWRPFGLTGEASPPYSSTPYATGDGEARRSGIVQGRQCDRALLVPAVVLCGCAGSARVSLAVHVWRRETARLAGTIGSSPSGPRRPFWWPTKPDGEAHSGRAHTEHWAHLLLRYSGNQPAPNRIDDPARSPIVGPRRRL